MKKYLFAILILCICLGLRAQTMQNFIASPSTLPLNTNLHIEYDLFNTSSANITGNVDNHVKVNGIDLGVLNTFNLANAILPNQSAHISFDIIASLANNFSTSSSNIIVIWPTGTTALPWISDNTGTAAITVIP